MAPATIERPKLSLTLASFSRTETDDWSTMFERAMAAEEAGIDRLVVSDHVAFGEALGDYARPELGGRTGGVQPTGPDGLWLEPLTVLAMVAARTTRIRVGTNILLAALRRPVVLAKTAATIDVLSGGRLDLGVGVGWQRAEYEAAGISFERRGRLLDHTLEVCHALWTEPRASYRSEELEFADIHQMPKPTRVGGVPVWVSGTLNPRTISRLARFAVGWIPWGEDAAQLEQSIPRMRAAMEDAGRDPFELGVVATVSTVRDADGVVDVEATMASVPGLIRAGVTDVRCSLPVAETPRADIDVLAALAQEFRRRCS
jgi:probable F420-dependent oxidoreductase